MFEFKFVDGYSDLYGANEAEAKKKKEALKSHVWFLMRGFTEDPKITVKYYPYRKAHVFSGNALFVAERDSLYGFECLLALKAGVRRLDNHVVYGVTRYGRTEYYWFTDGKVICGNEIQEH